MRLAAVVGACLALGTTAATPVALGTGGPPGTAELVLDGAGRVHVRPDPFAPAGELGGGPSARPDAVRAAAAQASSPGPGQAGHPAPVRPRTFSAGLAALAATGSIDQATYQRDVGDYSRARQSLRRLRGTRRAELAAVLANLAHVTTAGLLTPSRLPALMLTLNSNRQWWTTGPLLTYGQRVGFPGSRIVWQYYTGQGIEIHWLANFGKANGYFASGTHDGDLGALLDELLGLAAQRAGGIAWEYEFRFDGGQPPWVSGLAEGTAVQSLSRAAIRLGQPRYFTAARAGLGIFAAPPPEGVRVATAAGAHYLIYSFAPGVRVLNGFVQALVGLNDFAALANDAVGKQLFAAGDAEARLEVPQYDTGAWSLYDQSTESDLAYHDLLRGFLANLCQRTQGTRVSPLTSSADAVYCTTAQHFATYLHQPPTLVLLPPVGRLRAGRPGLVGFSLSKISTFSWTATAGGRPMASGTGLVGHGRHSLRLMLRRPGRYAIRATATDLAGNATRAAEQIVVASAPPH